MNNINKRIGNALSTATDGRYSVLPLSGTRKQEKKQESEKEISRKMSESMRNWEETKNSEKGTNEPNDGC